MTAAPFTDATVRLGYGANIDDSELGHLMRLSTLAHLRNGEYDVVVLDGPHGPVGLEYTMELGEPPHHVDTVTVLGTVTIKVVTTPSYEVVPVTADNVLDAIRAGANTTPRIIAAMRDMAGSEVINRVVSAITTGAINATNGRFYIP